MASCKKGYKVINGRRYVIRGGKKVLCKKRGVKKTNKKAAKKTTARRYKKGSIVKRRAGKPIAKYTGPKYVAPADYNELVGKYSQ